MSRSIMTAAKLKDRQSYLLKLPVEPRLDIYQQVLPGSRFPRYARHIPSSTNVQVCRLTRDECAPVYDERVQQILELIMAAEGEAVVAYRSFKEDGSRASAIRRIVLQQQLHATTDHSDCIWRLVQKKRLALEREGFRWAVPPLHFW